MVPLAVWPSHGLGRAQRVRRPHRPQPRCVPGRGRCAQRSCLSPERPLRPAPCAADSVPRCAPPTMCLRRRGIEVLGFRLPTGVGIGSTRPFSASFRKAVHVVPPAQGHIVFVYTSVPLTPTDTVPLSRPRRTQDARALCACEVGGSPRASSLPSLPAGAATERGCAAGDSVHAAVGPRLADGRLCRDRADRPPSVHGLPVTCTLRLMFLP
jgi:hypothetical protein